jgi:hypothetical protein
MNSTCKAKWREVHTTANILQNNARLSGAFFHHAHAYAVHIINVCPAKNVIDQDGNPTTPYQYSFQHKPCIANFQVIGWPSFFKRFEPTFRNKLIPTNSNFNAPLAASSSDSLTTLQAG